MKSEGADEIVLETEITNIAALKLYESFGFIRDKRLLTYYLNGNDAYKLKLYIKWRSMINVKIKSWIKKLLFNLHILYNINSDSLISVQNVWQHDWLFHGDGRELYSL